MPEAARRIDIGTLLGFDYGPAKIGVAAGQTLTGTATPLTTLRAVSGKPDWEGIGRLIEEWRPEALVVGLPFNMDDSESGLAEHTRRFARQLKGRFHLPVHLVDERLTSIEARRLTQGKVKKIEVLDAIAAKLILETWLREQT